MSLQKIIFKIKFNPFVFLLLSLLIHIGIFSTQRRNLKKKVTSHKFHIQNIRVFNSQPSSSQESVSPLKLKKKLSPTLKSLGLTQIPLPKRLKEHTNSFLKSPSLRFIPSAEALSQLSNTGIGVQLDFPEKAPADEFNTSELVFYSFQKRTFLTYLNSFQKELNSFQVQNPHLHFPLTKQEQSLAGKITYDRVQPPGDVDHAAISNPCLLIFSQKKSQCPVV